MLKTVFWFWIEVRKKITHLRSVQTVFRTTTRVQQTAGRTDSPTARIKKVKKSKNALRRRLPLLHALRKWFSTTSSPWKQDRRTKSSHQFSVPPPKHVPSDPKIRESRLGRTPSHLSRWKQLTGCRFGSELQRRRLPTSLNFPSRSLL